MLRRWLRARETLLEALEEGGCATIRGRVCVQKSRMGVLTMSSKTWWLTDQLEDKGQGPDKRTRSCHVRSGSKETRKEEAFLR